MKFIKGILIALAIVITCIGIAVFYFFFCLQCVPTGELIGKFESPNKECTVNTYRSNGGATVDFAVRGEVQCKKNKKPKTIYWDYHKYDSNVEWTNNDTIIINGHTLDVFKDTYDWRNE